MLQSIRLRAPLLVHRRIVNSRFFSDDEKPKERVAKTPKVKKVKNDDAMKRLNDLLENISKPAPPSDAKVLKAPEKRKKFAKKSEDDDSSDDEKARVATAQIAQRIGGEDVRKTEQELLSKLLGLKDLKSSGSLHDLISSMQIDAESEAKPKQDQRRTQDPSRAENVRRSMGGKQPRTQRKFDQSQVKSVIDIFGGKPLNIFDVASTAEDPLKTWDMLHKKEMRLAVTHPPSNYFEKMIQWTDQGKVWKFPIDNEQGMDVEFNTDFSEHVLLEMHLEDWCPTSGPVRHFMELVCVGLSNNHWLTAAEKRDHIMWYRDYFNEKKEYLGELLELGRTIPADGSKGGQAPQLES